MELYQKVKLRLYKPLMDTHVLGRILIWPGEHFGYVSEIHERNGKTFYEFCITGECSHPVHSQYVSVVEVRDRVYHIKEILEMYPFYFGQEDEWYYFNEVR